LTPLSPGNARRRPEHLGRATATLRAAAPQRLVSRTIENVVVALLFAREHPSYITTSTPCIGGVFPCGGTARCRQAHRKGRRRPTGHLSHTKTMAAEKASGNLGGRWK